MWKTVDSGYLPMYPWEWAPPDIFVQFVHLMKHILPKIIDRNKFSRKYVRTVGLFLTEST